MKGLNEADQMLVSRYVDGELRGDDLVEFERRLLQEPRLREAADGQREVRQWFAQTSDDSALTPPSGFAEKALLAARRLPPREALLGEVAVRGEVEIDRDAAMRTGKGLLAAAALVLGFSVVFASGLIERQDAGYLQAIDQERIERIDQEREEVWQREEVLRPR